MIAAIRRVSSVVRNFAAETTGFVLEIDLHATVSDQGRGMRATGGAVNPPARSCSMSHRICQIRPSTKPIAIATEISKTIKSAKVIGMFLFGLMPLGCPCKSYRTVFTRIFGKRASRGSRERDQPTSRGGKLLFN